MISVFDIEERVFEYLDKLYSGDQVQFGFGLAASTCFFVDRQTNAPRLAASTLLYYRVSNPEKIGNLFSGRPYINRETGLESIDINKRVKVTLNYLSILKGCAKDAFNFLDAVNQTTRHYEAAYNTGDFDFPLYDMGNPIDLSEIETAKWVERIQVDTYFNYTDTISLGETQSLIEAPSSVAATKDKIQFEIDMN